MGPLPFYAISILGSLALLIAFLSGSDGPFAVSIACSAVLGFQAILPCCTPVVSTRNGKGRLDIRVDEEMPPLAEEPEVRRARKMGPRQRSILALVLLAAGWATLAFAWAVGNTWLILGSLACSAASIPFVPAPPAAGRGRSARGGGKARMRDWKVSLGLGPLRVALQFAPSARVEAEDASALGMDTSRRLTWQEALALADDPPSRTDASDVLVGDSVAHSLRARWGARPTPQSQRS